MQIAEKGRGVAISPKSNGEQICNQLISDWEIFDPVTNGTSYLFLSGAVSIGSEHRTSTAVGLKSNYSRSRALHAPCPKQPISSSVSHPSGHVHTIFTPVPDNCTTFRSSPVSAITYSHSLRENIFENNVY